MELVASLLVTFLPYEIQKVRCQRAVIGLSYRIGCAVSCIFVAPALGLEIRVWLEQREYYARHNFTKCA